MKVSVIVPVYRVETTLDRCVSSIVGQTYQDLQIILVDDGSPDKCPQLCDAWKTRDSRIEVIHKTNGGLSDARNAGLAQATGEAIFFVDSDDYLDPDCIETMVAAMQCNHADLVICSISEETADGGERYGGSSSTVDSEIVCDAHECFRRSSDWRYIPAWNKLYSARLWDNVQFPKGRIHEDEFVFHHIVDQCSTIVVLPSQFYHYVENPTSIMHVGFSVKNLVRMQALFQRLLFFVNRQYNDCFDAAFDMIMVDLGSADTLIKQYPETSQQVLHSIAEVRKLPFSIFYHLTVKHKIRFLQLKCCPNQLMHELGHKQRQQAFHR